MRLRRTGLDPLTLGSFHALSIALLACACSSKGGATAEINDANAQPPLDGGGGSGGSGGAGDGSVPDTPGPGTPVEIQILSVSDWHGQLEPLQDGETDKTEIGGAAVLSAYFKAERKSNPNTITLTAGDAFGASPPLASLFEEKPAVQAMNLMKFDGDAFGNHNFDRGLEHLQSMMDLATFKYVASNLEKTDKLKGLATPFHLLDVAGVKIGLLGITSPDAPTLVFPGRLGDIVITDPIPAAQKAAAAARKAGAKIVIALAHLGATAVEKGTPSGPLIDFANGVSGSGVDIILGDHTDFAVNTNIGKTLVVENRSKGRTYAKIRLKVDPFSGAIADMGASFVTPKVADVTPDEDIEKLLAKYKERRRGSFDEKIGELKDELPKGDKEERTQEMPIGNLVADAVRARYKTQLAVMNGGGIRPPLPSLYAPLNMGLRRTTPGYSMGPPYDIVIGDVYSVLPFGNSVVTRTVTAQQVWDMLENSVSKLPETDGRFLQISGFKFVYRIGAEPLKRVVSVALDGGAAVPKGDTKTTYTMALLDFMNTGGDGYDTVFADGKGDSRFFVADDLLDFIKATKLPLPPDKPPAWRLLDPVTSGRITEKP